MTETGSLVDTRLGVEVAASVDWGGLGPFVRLSRFSFEIAAKYPGMGVLVQPRISRFALEIAGDSPTNPSDPQVTRLGVEVAAESPEAKALVTRLGGEVAAETDKPRFRISRMGVEVGAPRPGTVEDGGEPVVLPFYLHNWAHELEMETTFPTDVSQDPDAGGRERRSLLSKPTRILSPHWNPDIARGSRDLLWDLVRLGNDRLLIPLYQDRTKVTQPSSGTFVSCDPSKRRIFANSRVIIYKRDRATKLVSNVQSRLVQSISDFGITLTQAVSGSPQPQDWFVVPGMYAEISLEEDLELLTDGVADFAPAFVEAGGSTAIRMIEDGEGGYWPTHLGFAVFPIDVDWSSSPKVGMRRQGQAEEQGKGTAVSLRGTRPELVQEVQITTATRSDSWEMVRFLETRRGRTRPFWMPLTATLTANSTLLNLSPTEIEVNGTHPRILNLQDFLKAIAIRTKAGDVFISRVDQVAQGISSWTISLLDPLPGDLEIQNIKKLVPCTLSSMASDSFTERWTTDGVARFSFSTIELPIEDDVITPDLEEEDQHVEPFSLIWILAPNPPTN